MEGNMSADKHHIQQKVTAAIREDRKKKYDTAVIISPVTLREIAKTLNEQSDSLGVYDLGSAPEHRQQAFAFNV